MKELVKIYTGHSLTVKHLASLLDEAGIPHLIKDREESARLAGFGSLANSVELHVYRSDAERAWKVVEDFEEEMEREDEAG